MRASPAKSHLVTVVLVAFLGVAGLSSAQFTSFSDRSQAMLEGNWQSCRESDGQYSERVYDGKWAGMQPFELHMGPYHEFALFQGIQDQHRDHASAENLLRPSTVQVIDNRATQTWDVAGFHLQVALAGGSREDCESWFVSLRRAKSPSSF